MSEVTMLSRMTWAGLICTFQCNGTVERDITLTVRVAGKSKEHTYSCARGLGTSKLITLAWGDWEPMVVFGHHERLALDAKAAE